MSNFDSESESENSINDEEPIQCSSKDFEKSRKNGFIYKYEGPLNIPDKCKMYIGYSTMTLNKRKHKHIAVFKRYAKGDPPNGYNRHLCEAVVKFKLENFDIFMVEDNVKYDDLDDREIFWIKELNTLHPNGYNIQAGGDNATASLETRQLLSKVGRRSEISENMDLPMYIQYYDKTRNKHTRHGFKVEYPCGNSIKSKTITVRKPDPITDEMLEEAKRYLAKFIEECKCEEQVKKSLTEEEAVLDKNLARRSEESKELDLPLYIHYCKKHVSGKENHGLRIHYNPSGKTKYILIPKKNNFKIDVTSEIIDKAKEYLAEMIEEYESNIGYQSTSSEASIKEIKQSGKKKDHNGNILPTGISLVKNSKNHGYRIFHRLSGKSKSITQSSDKPITDDMLNKALSYYSELEENYKNGSYKEEDNIPKLPKYINNYKVTTGPHTRHGYMIRHYPSNKTKYVLVRQPEPITEEMLNKAKKILEEIVKEYEDSLSNDMEKLDINKKDKDTKKIRKNKKK
jgi:hypothetical protein